MSDVIRKPLRAEMTLQELIETTIDALMTGKHMGVFQAAALLDGDRKVLITIATSAEIVEEFPINMLPGNGGMTVQ